MGQKVNPISLRLQQTNRSFDSHWFSLYYYKDLLSRDLAVGHYLTDIANLIKESQARVSSLSLPKRSKILLAFFRGTRSQNSPLSRKSFKTRQPISKVETPSSDSFLPFSHTLSSPRPVLVRGERDKEKSFFQLSHPLLIREENNKNKEKVFVLKSYLFSHPVRDQIVDITTARLKKKKEEIGMSSPPFPSLSKREIQTISFDFLGKRMRKLFLYWYLSSIIQKGDISSLLRDRDISDNVQRGKEEDFSQVINTKGYKETSSYLKRSVTTLRFLITSFAKNPRLLYKETRSEKGCLNTQKKEERIISKNLLTLSTLCCPLSDRGRETDGEESLFSVLKRKEKRNRQGLQRKERRDKNLSFLQQNLSRIHLHPVWLEGLRIPNQNQSSSLLAQEIVYYLEGRTPLYQIKGFLFKSLEKMKFVKGVRISLSGRLGGRTKKAQRGQTETFQYGETKFHLFSSKIDYYSTSALTPFGRVGVKVWLSFADNPNFLVSEKFRTLKEKEVRR